jgi:4-oxalocrotonate tautomerase
MPHILIKLVPGKSEQQKQEVTDAISRDVAQILGYDPDAISISIEEVPVESWAQAVYRPEIVGKPTMLYKKPGYTL